MHFVSGEKSVNRMIEAVCAEWARVAFQSSDEEIERAKRSLKTNLMLQMDGESFIDHRKYILEVIIF